jgi:hypothetical protein
VYLHSTTILELFLGTKKTIIIFIIICTILRVQPKLGSSVADTDPTYHFDADLDPGFYLMRIWILIFIRCGYGSDFLLDAEPDPAF